MKKQEFIHLHSLMVEEARYIAAEEEYGAAEPQELPLYEVTDSLGIQDYEDLGTRPASLHHSKSDHKAAVKILAEGIADYLDGACQACRAAGLEA